MGGGSKSSSEVLMGGEVAGNGVAGRGSVSIIMGGTTPDAEMLVGGGEESGDKRGSTGGCSSGEGGLVGAAGDGSGDGVMRCI